MAHTPKDTDKVDEMNVMRKVIALEVELRLEREQHALAKQCITYLSLQLAAQDPGYTHQALTEQVQNRGRRPERSNRTPDVRIRQEIEQRVECKNEKRAGPEDLLGCDDVQVQSLGSPTTLLSNTPSTPLSAGFDEESRVERHAFLNRDQAGPKLVDDSDDPRDTLFTFKDSGVVDDEDSDPKLRSNVQHDAVPAGQREEEIQKPLSLENLSDRFKNNDPTIDSINASRWTKAETEKRVQAQARVQGIPEDLMQFPADEGESTEVELEEAKDTRSEEEMEVAKQKHAAELRKNQALVMYDPAPSEESLRTILVGDIPADMTMADVTRMVCGGIIIKIQSMHTTPLTGNESMLITFLRAKDARDFLGSVRESSKPTFSLLETPTYPLNEILADDIRYNGVTRCLAIYNLHRDITPDILRNALCQWEIKDDRIINVHEDEQGVCHVEFRSVLAAFEGRDELQKLFRRYSRVEHGHDPCDRPVPGVFEDTESKETGGDESLEDGEIRKSKDEDEVEDEAENKAGAESSSDSAVERDADGWPIGGLDY